MFPIIDDRVPIPALANGVLGFAAGFGLGVGFLACVFAFDLGAVSSLWARTGGIPLGELGMLPVTFALVGLVAGPALGGGRRGDPEA